MKELKEARKTEKDEKKKLKQTCAYYKEFMEELLKENEELIYERREWQAINL